DEDGRRGRLFQHLEQKVHSLPMDGLCGVNHKNISREPKGARCRRYTQVADLLDEDVSRDGLDELDVKIDQTFHPARRLLDLAPPPQIFASSSGAGRFPPDSPFEFAASPPRPACRPAR